GRILDRHLIDDDITRECVHLEPTRGARGCGVDDVLVVAVQNQVGARLRRLVADVRSTIEIEPRLGAHQHFLRRCTLDTDALHLLGPAQLHVEYGERLLDGSGKRVGTRLSLLGLSQCAVRARRLLWLHRLCGGPRWYIDLILALLEYLDLLVLVVLKKLDQLL